MTTRRRIGWSLLLLALVWTRLASAEQGAAPSAPSVPTASCAAVAGAEAWLRAGVTLLLGEIHGTEEAPRAVETWVCQAAARDLPVLVALEIPRSEQDRIDRFLASAGDEAARADLLSGVFWTRTYQDGRSSRAMASLLAALHQSRRSGVDVRVSALDIDGAGDRDAAMAGRLADEIRGEPRRFAIALAGNWHTRLIAGAPWDTDYRPLGLQLRELAPGAEIVSFDLAHSGGSAWVCYSADAADCAVRRLKGDGRASASIELVAAAGPAPFSGRQNLGEIHASLPARTP
jgi:hypothetical protein